MPNVLDEFDWRHILREFYALDENTLQVRSQERLKQNAADWNKKFVTFEEKWDKKRKW